MDFLRLSKMRRPSSTPATIEAKLSSSRIMSAAFFVTGVPAMPMAMPMSAFFSAGESLTPSPVTATMWPRRWQLPTMTSFCCGDVRAKTICGCSRMASHLSSPMSSENSQPGQTMACAESGSWYPASPGLRRFSALERIKSSLVGDQRMPTLYAMAFAVPGWSPVTMITLMPAVLHLATAPGTASRGGSIRAIMPRKMSGSPESGCGGSTTLPFSSLSSSPAALASAYALMISYSPSGKLAVEKPSSRPSV
mmetsp:Transcript_8580/g.28243  ORF Transcript_8580/g.28243 Transcript_8580/m.28243 type:complete len:251 (+) Transcript_8580:1829-2581(+)